jgi:ABC-type transporter Mla MlaB component
MFRITEHRGDSRIVLKLEGRFSQGVVNEVDACWRAATKESEADSIWVDLTDVHGVDPTGQAQLARMHREGVRFLTRGCFMRELVREIAEAR